MRPVLAGVSLIAGLCVAAGALACNPDPPVPPILEGYAYDRMAAETLVRDAASVVTARLDSIVRLELADGPSSATYVFLVLDGWKAVEPRRLAIDGTWVSCDLDLERGRVFLLYLDGPRLLYAVPAEALEEELALLGDVEWFYGPSGQLVEPVEQE